MDSRWMKAGIDSDLRMVGGWIDDIGWRSNGW